MGMSAKRLRFCEEYCVDFNGTKAAVRAGYNTKTANEQAAQLLAKEEIQQKIAELQAPKIKELKITRERVLEELAAVGFAKITDFLEVKTEEREISFEVPGDKPDDFDELLDDEPLPKTISEKRSYKVVEIFDTANMNPLTVPAIASIKQGRNGIEIKMHDKPKALELLGKHLSLFIERLDVTSNGESVAPVKPDLSKLTKEELQQFIELSKKVGG